MTDREHEDARVLWHHVADDWRFQVDDDGDGNRHLNADPVLWAFATSNGSRRHRWQGHRHWPWS